MNFKRYLMIISVFSLAQGTLAQAQRSELATSEQQNNIYKDSKPFWSNNLCRQYTEDGKLEVVRPLVVAIKTCPERRDYGQTEKTYEKIDAVAKVTQNQLEDFFRNADGTVKTIFNQYEANQLCKVQGKRLPTARELAIEATKYGAKILELKKSSDETPDDSYKKISVVNADGTKDEFYFSDKNYDRPAGDLGAYWIWASSVPNDDSLAFVLDGHDGSLGVEGRTHSFSDGAVRCVGSAGVNR